MRARCQSAFLKHRLLGKTSDALRTAALLDERQRKRSREIRESGGSVCDNGNPASCFAARHLQTADKAIMIQDSPKLLATRSFQKFDLLRPPQNGALRYLGPLFPIQMFKSVLRSGILLTKMTCNLKDITSDRGVVS